MTDSVAIQPRPRSIGRYREAAEYLGKLFKQTIIPSKKAKYPEIMR